MTKNTTYSINDKLGFGKYRNLTVKQVLERDPNYINWCKQNIPHFQITDNTETQETKQQHTYPSQPIDEQLDILLCTPWNKQYLKHYKDHTTDAQIIQKQPQQLLLWA